MNPDVSIFIGDTKFNFRVAGLITNGNKVLLHKNKTDDFWNLVGGRVKCGENTKEALTRELKEELNFNCQNLKLLTVAENFFTYNGSKAHELLFIYLVEATGQDIVKKQDFDSVEEGKAGEFIYHWFEKEEVKNIVCKPDLIYNLIYQPTDTITHLFEN